MRVNVVTVPDGPYGRTTALDGAPMPEGMFITPKIDDGDLAEMFKAEVYLNRGGLRGPQETVLKLGQYRLDRYLFDVRTDITLATVIPAGHVGVVKSNVVQPGMNCFEEEVQAGTASGALTVPLVPRGCAGIWKEPLLPGAYYLNLDAYQVTLVDTRVQT